MALLVVCIVLTLIEKSIFFKLCFFQTSFFFLFFFCFFFFSSVVEKGMDDNSEIKFERMSEQRPGMIPGDVIMVLKQKAHAQYRREKNDLHYDLTITLKESLIGFTRTIRHLDGHEVVRLSLSLSLSLSVYSNTLSFVVCRSMGFKECFF